MQSLKKVFLSFLVTVLSACAVAGEKNSELAPFAPASEGSVRFVIQLPVLDAQQEKNSLVELIVGKHMLTDGVNLIRLANRIETKNLSGWGYSYYEVQDSPLTMSTMMAAPEGAEQVMQFVTMAPLKINYNSRLPIVVYVPQDYEVQYKIWQAIGVALTAGIQ